MSGVISVDHHSLRDIRIALYEAVNGTDEDAMDINYSAEPTGTENEKTMDEYSAQGNVHTSPRSCVNA